MTGTLSLLLWHIVLMTDVLSSQFFAFLNSLKAVTAHNIAEMVHNIILLLSPIMPIIPKCTSFENKPFKDRYTPKIQKLNAKTTTKN